MTVKLFSEITHVIKIHCLRMSYSSKTDLSAMTRHYPILDK